MLGNTAVMLMGRLSTARPMSPGPSSVPAIFPPYSKKIRQDYPITIPQPMSRQVRDSTPMPHPQGCRVHRQRRCRAHRQRPCQVPGVRGVGWTQGCSCAGLSFWLRGGAIAFTARAQRLPAACRAVALAGCVFACIACILPAW